jgi:hypothetical protein
VASPRGDPISPNRSVQRVRARVISSTPDVQQQQEARFTRAGADAGRHTPVSILARLDRIDVWSLPFLFIGIIGTGFLFTFYDIFDINVSFVRSCVELKPGCTPETALGALKLPVLLNLAGYVFGHADPAVLVIAPLIPKMSVFGAFMLVSGFLVVAAVFGMFGVETRNKRFEEISP